MNLKNSTTTYLLKNDTILLKGFGILIIIFHNFYHLLKPIVGENEYDFNSQYYQNFLYFTVSDPWNFIQYISAYFGHYGVPLFVFLSGYGLATSYSNNYLIFKEFIKKRLIKLYPIFTLGIILALIYKYIIFQTAPFTLRTLGSLVIRFTQVANFIPHKAFSFYSTYWFYSMIIQLYFCFPILLSIQKRFKYGLPTLLLLSYSFLVITNSYFSSIGVSLYYNFAGNLPVFISGILLASTTIPLKIKANYYLIPVIGIFLIGQYFEPFWHFTQLSFVIVVVILFKLIQKKWKRNFLSIFILYTGKLSMYLFAVSGLLRVPWTTMSNSSENDYAKYFYFIIYILITYTMALLFKKIESLLFDYFKWNAL